MERGDPGSMDRPEFGAVRLIVADLKEKGLWDKNAGVSRLETALKWFNGPDIVTIQAADKKRHVVADCYLNMNAEDFGIELDRVVKINVSEDARVFDGEILNGRLLNRLVGLFRTDRLNPRDGVLKFVPDKYFYDGVTYDGSAFEELMGEDDDFIHDLEEAQIRPDWQIQAWKDTVEKFDLCPVTPATAATVCPHDPGAAALDRAIRGFRQLWPWG